MLQFAAPLGLIALAALLAPILIHLIRGPLQTVRLGSLRFLDGNRRRLSSWRWQEHLLLALRCALLAALALLLAGPSWRPTVPAPARWVLRLPGAKFEPSHQAEWERLKAEGYDEKSWLDLASQPESTNKNEARSPAAAAALDVWSLLREADYRLPAQSRVVIFGPALSTLFHGERPTLSRVEAVWRATPATSPAASPLSPKPKPLRAAIVAGADRQEDANYVRAMLTALGVTLGGDQPDWIFQLGGAPIPPALLERVQQGAHLVSDSSSSEIAIVSRSFDTGLNRPHLRQRSRVSEGAPFLQDSTGESIATEVKQGLGHHWQFALRFHPDWSDWPLTSGFPGWWQRQLMPAATEPILVSAEQATPRYEPASAAAVPVLPGFGVVDGRRACWLIALVLFLFERGVSWRTRPTKAAA